MGLPIPPSYFAIPSVKAEVKTGFVESSRSGVNIILFSKREQREDYGESSVTFELAAVPPPPDAARDGNYFVPIPAFLVLDEERDRILDAAHRKISAWPTYGRGRDQAVVLSLDPSSASSGQYIVIWPAWPKPPHPVAFSTKWGQISVFYFEKSGDELVPSTDIFSRPLDDSFLRIVNNEETPDDLRSFGDAVMQFTALLKRWIDAVRISQTPSENNPGSGN
ncbi:MAG: hypothetical protein JRJ85_05345 [Deltaproteobacteria bacterium]|nr:hypothetical protein [Deltaproteobacteria bacterium]